MYQYNENKGNDILQKAILAVGILIVGAIVIGAIKSFEYLFS